MKSKEDAMKWESRQPKYPIHDEIEVPGEVLENWQATVDLLARIANVPAALVMRVHHDEIEVFVRSNSPGNVYHPNEKAPLDTGLYCETVMNTRQQLLVPDALSDQEWASNPDIALGMISYCGLPLQWPSGRIFGTICILDQQVNAYSPDAISLLERFRDSVQFNLGTIYETHVTQLALGETKSVLQERDEQLQLMVDGVRDYAILMLDPAGNVVSWNTGAERIQGFHADEIIGRHYSVFYSEGAAGRGARDAALATAVVEGRFEEEAWCIRKNGERYVANVIIAPLYDQFGCLRGFSKITRDITERKSIEGELEKYRFRLEDLVAERTAELSEANVNQAISEQKFRGVAEHGPFALLVSDLAQNSLYVNSMFERLFGYTLEDLPSVETWWLLAYPDPEDRQEARARWNSATEQALCDRLEIPPQEADVTCKDGRVVPVEFRMVSTGEFNFVIGMDISERRAANRALEAAKFAAESASQAKSDFLARMSHELRTPMNVISGMCYLAQRTTLDSRQKHYLQNIEVSAKTLLALINDVLDLAKIEADKLSIESEPFSLEEMLEHMVRIQAFRAEEKALEFNVLIRDGVPSYLVGDGARLGQVCSNLISNAIKFTDFGEVKLSVSKIGQTSDGVTLRFEVSDTGIGIAPEVFPRLFQPFEQADESTTRRFGGTGLGLSICRRLLEAMGGEIGATSEIGQGSTFFFQLTLPVAHALTYVHRAQPPRALKVLVVDDNPSTQEVLQSILTSFSYRVDIAGSGEAAIAKLQSAVADEAGGDSYDLVLMDWRMPGMDGIETTRRIRADKSLPKTPIVIMVTAYGSDEVRERAAGVGTDGFLVKPVTPSVLNDAIQMALARQSSDASSGFIQPGANGSLSGLRVLVVEDSAISQEILAAMLDAAEIEFTAADSGEKALKCLKALQYDVILMDIEMPHMNGFEVAREIRSAQLCDERTAIVMMSAHDMAEVQGSLAAVGANDVLGKPIMPEALYSILRRWDARSQFKAALPDFSGARVLLVEDAPANRELMRELLQQAGVEVIEAENGAIGSAYLETSIVDAVLMDIQMPVMDGFQGLCCTNSLRVELSLTPSGFMA